VDCARPSSSASATALVRRTVGSGPRSSGDAGRTPRTRIRGDPRTRREPTRRFDGHHHRHLDADRYLHLALQETGIASSMDGETSAACRKTARPSPRLIGGSCTRLHQPFLPTGRTRCGTAACLGHALHRKLETGATRPPRTDLAAAAIDDGSTGSELEAVRARALATIAQSQYSPPIDGGPSHVSLGVAAPRLRKRSGAGGA
jgi:hypothetical protein